MLVLLMALGCAAYHKHTPDSDLNVTATPYGARQIVDAETGNDAVAKASRDVPVTYVTTTKTPFGETSTQVTVGGGYAAPTSRGGYDARPDASADYRARYLAQTRSASIPGAKNPSTPHATGTAPALQTATCPTDRAPATQAELDACQSGDISHILDTVGTVKGVK